MDEPTDDSSWLRIDPATHVHFETDEASGRRRLRVESITQQRFFELFTREIFLALEHATDWIRRPDLLGRLAGSGMDRERADRFIDDLLASGLLERAASVAERTAEDDRARRWAAAGVAASRTLLLAKRHQRYLDYRQSEARAAEETLMQAYRDEGPPPPTSKRYSGADPLGLGEPEGEPALGRLADGARPARPQLISRRRLSAILRHAFGATGAVDDPAQGIRLLKTHPSGGARHPLECYLAALDVEGVATGLYHYSVADHALAPLPGGGRPEDLAALIAPEVPPPPLLFVLTATPERVMWRYREPTSFFAMMLDAGHALENFCFVCRCERLAHAAYTAVPAREIADRLGLSPLTELPVAALAVGGPSAGGGEETA